jgi:hypothetical protein
LPTPLHQRLDREPVADPLAERFRRGPARSDYEAMWTIQHGAMLRAIEEGHHGRYIGSVADRLRRRLPQLAWAIAEQIGGNP